MTTHATPSSGPLIPPPPADLAEHNARPEPGRHRHDDASDQSGDQQANNPYGPNTGPARHQVVRSWPLLALALPAAVTIWSGWVGIGTMTGFGLVHPLPGIWDSLRVNTAVTLPVGVEAYAAYALRAWLSASTAITARTRRFARRSAIGSLLLGMAGQAGYHLLTQSHTAHAPWPITTAVSCLPVLVLGMGAALAHLLRDDTRAATTTESATPKVADQASHPGQRVAATASAELLAQAKAAAQRLTAAGQPVSRRALRNAGVRGSNAALGLLARTLSSDCT